MKTQSVLFIIAIAGGIMGSGITLGISHISSAVRSSAHTKGQILVPGFESSQTKNSPERAVKSFSARVHISESEPYAFGFVISGSDQIPAIIRVLGPSLKKYGITDFTKSPRLVLYRNNHQVLDADIQDASYVEEQVAGAFPRIPSDKLGSGEKEVSIKLLLRPGVYTLEVLGDSSHTGTSVMEVYTL